MPPKAEFQSVKVPMKTYEKLHKLLDVAAKGGWSAFGVDRTDRPSLGALLDEGITLLEAKAKARK